MKKRVISVLDIPESTKITNRDIIYNTIRSSNGISFTQLMDNLGAKSSGNTHHNLKILISAGRVKKETCKCCNTTELYKICQ